MQHARAADAFTAFYQLEELKRVRDHVFRQTDALALPTVPTVYTIEQVPADPIGLNSRLGTYTNFVNLLDLAALAVPAALRPDGTPFGITLMAPAGHDAALAAVGRVIHADTGLLPGALGRPQPRLQAVSELPADGEVAIAVVGAHLSGMPLNGELLSLGACACDARIERGGVSVYRRAGVPEGGLNRPRRLSARSGSVTLTATLAEWSTAMGRGKQFRELLQKGGLIIAPGAYDCITAS